MATTEVRILHTSRIVGLAVALVVAAVVGAPVAQAGVYPGNKCVSSKQKEAGKYCSKVFKAWSQYQQTGDAVHRDSAIQSALVKLQQKWGKAEGKSAQKGTDCVDTTVEENDLAADIDAAAMQVESDISGADPACAAKILKAAGKKCSKLLKAESKYIKKLEKDPQGTDRDADKASASEKFSSSWANATSGGCTPGATEAAVEASIDAISDDVVAQTIVSPNVSTSWSNYAPPTSVQYLGRTYTPRCAFDADPDYYYYARRGTVNKLVMYYMGGGACWENLTCSIPVCSDFAEPDGASQLNAVTDGFFDLSNPDNPFKDWHMIFVSYCTCDIHFGDNQITYSGIFPDIDVSHLGYHNSRVVEKWAREHFVNPEEIFVTGSSAGAYGALFNAPVNHEAWPASKLTVLADAGNGVITASFLQNEFNNWNFQANLPPIPGVLESITMGTGMVGYVEAITTYLPQSNWAHYTTAYDGGTGGQTGFYNIMLNGNDPIAALTWWEGSCQFNDVMRQQAQDTYASVSAADDNYRYYIGTGSRHTMWGHDKVYTDTTGGVPTVTDWIDAMLASEPGSPDPGWVNVEASPFNVLLTGDPRSTRQCSVALTNCNADSDCPATETCDLRLPFKEVGPDTVVDCSPSGAFLDTASGVLD
jgi:hypothetical protein